MGADAGQAVRPAAGACLYCLTGSASPYLRNKAAGRVVERRGKKEASVHEPACPRYGKAPEDRPEIVALYCQGCGQERTGDWLVALAQGYRLRCPRCARRVEHHPAPPEVVAAGECPCGQHRMERHFAMERAA